MNKQTNMNEQTNEWTELDWTGTRHGVQKYIIRLDMAVGEPW